MEVPESINRILIVGGGKMGEAILSGWLSVEVDPADFITPNNVIVVDPTIDRREDLEGMYAVECIGSVDELQEDDKPDLVVLAVKPQVMMEVLEGIRKTPAFQGGPLGPLFVSIAAGLTTDRLIEGLPAGAPVVRVMPNMPLMVGAGATAVCGSATSTDEQVQFVCDLFECLGRAVVVKEADMDAVCAVSGSGPAYVCAMIEALRDAGAECGLDLQVAEDLALQTVLGTAQMLEETGTPPATARESVCSPGGTTLAALDAMNERGFADVIRAGVQAAVRRSKELAES